MSDLSKVLSEAKAHLEIAETLSLTLKDNQAFSRTLDAQIGVIISNITEAKNNIKIASGILEVPVPGPIPPKKSASAGTGLNAETQAILDEFK